MRSGVKSEVPSCAVTTAASKTDTIVCLKPNILLASHSNAMYCLWVMVSRFVVRWTAVVNTARVMSGSDEMRGRAMTAGKVWGQKQTTMRVSLPDDYFTG